MQVVPVALDSLVPYAKNSRKHSKRQVEQLVRSLREFGWTNPVLVDGERGIIAGHGRVMAAKKIAEAGSQIPNWPDVSSAPTIELSHLTPEQRRAYVIADNQLALASEWDKEALSTELEMLGADAFDLSLMGFEDDVLQGLLPKHLKAGQADADEIPELQTRAVSVLGDTWVLGAHRITCGDSTEAAVVERLLAGVKPHLMVTDPPYGVEYDANWRNEATRADGTPIGASALGKVENDGRADWREAWALFPGEVAYVWHAGIYASTVHASLEAAGFEVRSQVIWAKPRFAISRGHYHWQHEPCWYAVRKGGKGHWGGGTRPEHAVVDRAPEVRDRAQHAEAGGVHAPAHRKQFEPGAGGVRAVLGFRHHDHRGGTNRPLLLRGGAQPAVRGSGGAPLANLHRPGRATRVGRRVVQRTGVSA